MSARPDDLEGNWRKAHPGHVPPRVTTPDYPKASIEAWRSSPAVRKERRRGIVIGFVLAMVVYGIGSGVLVMAFHALGVRP